MISKLIAWAEDRQTAIARMRGALDEYVISGIRTTLPFFRWLLARPEFVSGSFHTGYLDEVLAQRNGRPFVEPTPEQEDVAAIAAAFHAMLSSASQPGDARAAVERRWKSQARAEGLRE
jgi:acetyl/propionyl-CoA carboxylase alpha subunit